MSHLSKLGFDEETAANIDERVARGGLIVIAGGDAARRWRVIRAIVDDLTSEGTRVVALGAEPRNRGVVAGEASDPPLCIAAIEAARRGDTTIVGLPVADRAGAMRVVHALGGTATAVSVVTTRWLRKLCRSCAQPIGRMSRRERLLAFRYSTAPVLRAAGCPRCRWTGFVGEIPLARIDDEIGAGDAVELVRRGETAIDELAARGVCGLQSTPLHVGHS